MSSLRDTIARPLDRLAEKARRRRWAELVRRFPDLRFMRVLDLGGTPGGWRSCPIEPDEVVAVNLDPRHRSERRLRYVVADACALPEVLRLERFDLVYSNSLLEHVGGADRRSALARTVREMADCYWVQTPNRHFPIEPHWRFPAFQFMPFLMRVAISRTWPLGYTRSISWARALEDVAEVELLAASELRALFPDAELWPERFFGLDKSLVAVKTVPRSATGGRGA